MSENYKNIDDLFRDKFNDFEFEPPDHVWDNIKQTIHGPIGSNPGRSFRKAGFIGLSSIIILAGLFSIYQLQFSSSLDLNNDSDNIQNVLLQSNDENQDSSLLASQSTRGINIGNVQTDNFSIKDNKSPYENAEVVYSDDIESNISLAPNSIDEINSSQETTNISLPETNEIIRFGNDYQNDNLLNPADDSELLAIGNNVEENDISKKLDYQNDNTDLSYQSEQIDNSGSTTPVNPESTANPDIKSDYGKNGAFVFGLFFTPEIIFHPSDNKMTSNSYSLDLNAIYKFSGYMVQSGFGFQRSSDDGTYKVDYNKHLGSYEDVYDVTFDTTGGDVVPIYHTETVNVFDTITHVTINPTKSRYTYLQIPLLFGYGNDYKRFGWFVKAGPSLSIMIHDSKPDVYIPEEQYRILSIENEIPTRIKTHWQFVFSAGASFRLSNNLSISVEPMLRYYLSSAYERNKIATKHPYSIGLRAGFLINF
ncbi:MAG: hypothetical protein K8R68_02475 [Bacteroidales bacterium]|nr:hypothetical protein [Bacteroidales bacterium]